jgi:hypothetical protein
MTLGIITFIAYVECRLCRAFKRHYAECRYARCRGANLRRWQIIFGLGCIKTLTKRNTLAYPSLTFVGF